MTVASRWQPLTVVLFENKMTNPNLNGQKYLRGGGDSLFKISFSTL